MAQLGTLQDVRVSTCMVKVAMECRHVQWCLYLGTVVCQRVFVQPAGTVPVADHPSPTPGMNQTTETFGVEHNRKRKRLKHLDPNCSYFRYLTFSYSVMLSSSIALLFFSSDMTSSAWAFPYWALGLLGYLDRIPSNFSNASSALFCKTRKTRETSFTCIQNYAQKAKAPLLGASSHLYSWKLHHHHHHTLSLLTHTPPPSPTQLSEQGFARTDVLTAWLRSVALSSSVRILLSALLVMSACL